MCVCLKQRVEKTAVCAFPPFHHHAYYHHSAAQRAFPSTVCCWLTVDGEWEGGGKACENTHFFVYSAFLRGFHCCCWWWCVIFLLLVWFCVRILFIFYVFFCRGDLSACRSDLFFSEVFLWWFSGGFSAFQKVGGKA